MTVSAALLVFVLASAFLFLYVCHYTSYLASRTEGRQLVFLVGAAAFGLLFISRLLILILQAVLPQPVLGLVDIAWRGFFAPFDIPALSVYVGAFVIGPILALAVNGVYGADKASARAIRRYGTERERILFEAMEKEVLVSVTLDSRKVYIGWPIYSPDMRREAKDFRLLPAVSAYRDDKTMELDITTDYVGVYEQLASKEIEGLTADDFEIALPLEKVVSVNLFSLDIEQETFKATQGDGEN